MRAVVFDEQLSFHSSRPEPTPASGECLVRVHLAGICATDLQITRGYMDFRGVPGHEFVGTVAEGSENWKGRRVVAEINCVCRRCDMCQGGLSNHCRNRTVLGIQGRDGAMADFLTVPEQNLHAVPDHILDEEAVFIEPLAAAYQVLGQAAIDARMNVAVVGTGRLGLLVAQVLATTGCRLVAVGRNPRTLELCEKKGVQAVPVADLEPRHDQDVVVECSGSPEGLEIAMHLVRPRGTIVLKSTCAEPATINLAPLVVNEIRLMGSRCGPFPEAINALARQAVDVRSMVSRTVPIEQTAEAFAAAEDPRNVKILLKINPR
ncbi:MAG: alcohol dehydrogenase catalytic domain-containing protein [Phycisphaerae bacterium]|nr:alcohol dehydrogenase catalytic domain-containing protein [Phycisphaerae bacterium]